MAQKLNWLRTLLAWIFEVHPTEARAGANPASILDFRGITPVSNGGWDKRRGRVLLGLP